MSLLLGTESSSPCGLGCAAGVRLGAAGAGLGGGSALGTGLAALCGSALGVAAAGLAGPESGTPGMVEFSPPAVLYPSSLLESTHAAAIARASDNVAQSPFGCIVWVRPYLPLKHITRYLPSLPRYTLTVYSLFDEPPM